MGIVLPVVVHLVDPVGSLKLCVCTYVQVVVHVYIHIHVHVVCTYSVYVYITCSLYLRVCLCIPRNYSYYCIRMYNSQVPDSELLSCDILTSFCEGPEIIIMPHIIIV